MATSIGLWSLVVSANEEEPIEFSPPADLRITNVALGDELDDPNGRTSLKLIFPTETAKDSDDEEDEEDEDEDDLPLSTTVLCSLTPGKIEQATLDLIIESENVVLFQVVGKNTLYLTGNYISQPVPDDMPPYDEDEDSEEDDFDLRDVGSDVEMDPSALEVPSDDEAELAITSKAAKALSEASIKGKKRARDSDVSVAPTASATLTTTVDGDEEKLSKTQKKKLNKKLKTETGAAVPTGEDKPAADIPEGKKKDKKEKVAKPAAEVRELPGGLKVKDAKTGSGKAAKKGNSVSVRYIGKLENGKIFDQNTKGKPFSFNLGAGEVIKGWDQGIVGMQVGGERVLTVPAPLAYGKRKQGDIPANSTLIFEVKLLDVK